MSELAEDVAETLGRVEKELADLRQRHPEEQALMVHLAYNWRVAALLKEAGWEDFVPRVVGP